jgi:cytochrome c1
MRGLLAALGVAFALSLAAVPVFAAEEAEEPLERDWPHIGLFGTYDRAALQRGYRVYKDVCSACHSLKYISFRNLIEIGFTEAEAKAVASEFSFEAGPSEETGEMFDRAGLLSDTFPRPYANDAEARLSNNGALPPDLSLMAKAREDGTNYVFSLLVGYEEAPDDFDLTDGMNYNHYFAGLQIAMPQPLFEDMVEYRDGTPATVEQMAADVTQFLAWTAEPSLEPRHRMGFQVMVFLILLTILLYFVKRKVWADVH